jgi:hypothetical protein
VKLKSRGLGRKELVMDFREYTVTRDGPELFILGTIHEPVHWDFSIRLCEDDLPGIARVLLQRRMLGWLLRAAFRRNRHAHWSQDRATHLADARTRRLAADAKFSASAQPATEGMRNEGARG